MSDPQLARAATESEAALANGSGDAYDCMIVALWRADLGDGPAAQTMFDRALALEPGNPAVLTGLAKWYRQEGRLSDAVKTCDRAIAAAPDYPDAWIERGAAYAAGGSSRIARESFARAAALAPANAAAHAGFAALAARDGALDEARRAAEIAIRLDPAGLEATATFASVALEEGDPETARRVLSPVLARQTAGPGIAQGFNLLATAHERLGEHDAAFGYYARGKAEFAAQHQRRFGEKLPALDVVSAIAAGLRDIPPVERPTSGRPPPAESEKAPIFLLGFPRSGTTLVENVLASLDGVAALEERPTLAEVDRRFLGGGAKAIASGVQRFAAMPERELAALRTAYWDKVRLAGIADDTRHVVDMDPIKGMYLPFIARLFPAAKIVIMRRDPRDVVLSCFKTAFAPTVGNMEFTSLDRTARYYDAMMRLIALALERLPLDTFELDYHRLVRDFDATTQALCDFTGIAWSDAVRGFDRTAKSRGVTTASAKQVRKGLYDGSGQWRPYARQFAPVLPILQPWIERFGYA